MSSCAAQTLPPELWGKVWDGLAKGFMTTGFPEVHMEGECQCGKIQFRVDGNLLSAFWCHCHMCRKFWAQTVPAHTLWMKPETAVTFTAGHEYLSLYVVEKLSRNLRGQGFVNFCSHCGTKINVEFSDPNATFTLMWPYNFKYPEWGDVPGGRGDKARHGYSEMFRPRFHAHYENRPYDSYDGLLKLADIWLEDMPLMNDAGEITGKISYPLKGFENGWMSSPTEQPTAKL